MIRMLLILCLLCAPAAALEIAVPVDGLLGSYVDGETRTVTLQAALPADAVVSGLALSLSGTAVPGLYYDEMDPDQIVREFWGEFSPYFAGTAPHVYGWLLADAESWGGAVTWNAISGDVHWEFLNDGEQELSLQYIGPGWVGFPVIVRPLAVEITGAEAVITYQSEVANEPETWSGVKRLWR